MNKKNVLNLWLTRLAWGIIGLDIVLSVVPSCIFIPRNLDTQTTFLLNLILVAWLIITLCGATTWIIVHYRAFFRTWIGWITPFPVFILSSAIAQGIIPLKQGLLLSFFIMLQVISMWSIVPITTLLLLYRDVGLGLIGWGSLLVTWSYFLVWRYQDNVIEKILLSLSDPSQFQVIWWLNSLACILGWIIPAGVIGFFWHTIRLLVGEFQGNKFKSKEAKNVQ